MIRQNSKTEKRFLNVRKKFYLKKMNSKRSKLVKAETCEYFFFRRDAFITNRINDYLIIMIEDYLIVIMNLKIIS